MRLNFAKLADVDRKVWPRENTTRACTRGSLDSLSTRGDADSPPSSKPERVEPRGKPAGSLRRGSKLQSLRAEARRRIADHAAQTRLVTSNALDAGVAQGLIEAANEADRIGLPLNRFVSINWEKGGARDGSYATSAFVRLISAWLAHQGYQTAFIWVREAGRRNGQHAHLLIHLPSGAAKAYASRQCRWLAQCGLANGKGNVKGKPIGKTRSRAAGLAGAQATYRTHLTRVVHYLLKEVDAQGRDKLGVTLTGTGLPVTHKRAGTSENIGVAARARAGQIGIVARVGDLGRLSAFSVLH